MRILFIDNLLFEGDLHHPRFDLQPHLGLMSLVSVARSGGHEASIYDPKRLLALGELSLSEGLYEAMAEQILVLGADVVGFTALGCNFQCVVRVALRLRERKPDLPILLGGPHASILHEEILTRFDVFSVVVRHEAEETLLPVLDALYSKELNHIPGVSYRNPRGEVICNPGRPAIGNLNQLPIPAYDAYPLKTLGLESVRVEAGRGCPFACTFCSTASFFGRNYRLKSPERLLEEMEALRTAYGFTDFLLNHDLFTVNRHKVLDFCHAVRGRGFTWRCSARVDCVDDSLLEAMAEAGCRHIYFGIETGSPRMQKISCKRMDIELLEPVLATTSKLGICTTTSFITGFPEEQHADQKMTLDLVGTLHYRTDGLNEAQLHLLTPEPGTDLMTKYGSELRLDQHVSGFNFPRIDPKDHDLLATYPELFPNFYFFPSVLTRDRLIFVTTAWLLFNEIGYTTFGYILRAFNGSLWRLLDEAYHWMKAHMWGESLETVLAGFLAERFGWDHHLVSLFRYGIAIRNANADPCINGLKEQGDPRDISLVISSGVTVLQQIHDCSALLERINGDESQGLLDNGEAGPLEEFLVVAAPENARVFAIDLATANLINRFKEPTSYWQCCLAISKESEALFPLWEDVAGLQQMGVLRALEPVGQPT